MRLLLVGADLEENLGIGMIAATAQAAGHHVRILAFNDALQRESLAREVARARPDVVGLSFQFQHRAGEFASLARAIRNGGFKGHLTCGGMLASAAWRELLAIPAIDSVVMHEGESTVVDLLAAIAQERPLHEVPGLAIRTDDGAAVQTVARERPSDLDALPFPSRYRPHSKHLGVPFIPIMGSRGCWGRCAFCSISSFHLNARAQAGGKLLRQRSPDDIAQEMASLCGDGPALFCFHDDNFLLPRAERSLERVRAIRHAFDELSPGPIGIIGKTRPECLTVELAKELKALGVVRLYVGIENTSEGGAAHLAREVQSKNAREALAACREAGIFACYNLLIFEPEATLSDVRDNLVFMREQPVHPVNFCRAEAYTGTPLHESLAKRDALTGSWLGWNYRIHDDRAELLFRICAAAFRERNFAGEGVANRSMGLGYCAKILETFYPESEARTRLVRRGDELTRSIVLETTGFLEEAVELAEHADLKDHDTSERQTVLLGLRISAADQIWHAAMDEFHAELETLVKTAGALQVRGSNRNWKRVAKQVALGTTLVLSGTPACNCYSVDMVPPPYDATVADPVPWDSGRPDAWSVDSLPDSHYSTDATVADPLPADAGVDAGGFVDPLPPDAGLDAGGPVDPLPADTGHASLLPPGQWRDSASHALRSTDLPLSDPPNVRLVAIREGDAVNVTIVGAPVAITTRLETSGNTIGDGREIQWTPASAEDSLRVAVRTSGGVAVVSLRARDVAG